jgi:hypothetical protein
MAMADGRRGVAGGRLGPAGAGWQQQKITQHISHFSHCADEFSSATFFLTATQNFLPLWLYSIHFLDICHFVPDQTGMAVKIPGTGRK